MSNTNVSAGILELARPHLETLAAELDGGRVLRVAVAANLLMDEDCEDFRDDLEQCKDGAYELRMSIGYRIGDDLADEDEEEGKYGIPAITSFIVLRTVYGQNWARLAFADYLTYYSDVPCREPAAVANAIIERGEREYEAYASSRRKAA